jgi:serine protease
MRALYRTILAGTIFLASCGGGGGSDSDGEENPEPPPPPSSYTLTGTITASGSQAVDTDTNDRTREAVSNDTMSTAQPLPNPVTLGGYVNVAGTGPDGRSFESGDENDYFLIDLLADQRITMLVSDFAEADADLCLHDTSDVMIECSTLLGEVESLTAPADGSYLVRVYPFTGATNYTLAIGSTAALALPTPAKGEIVPGEIIVKYKDDDANPDISIQRMVSPLGMELGFEQRAGGKGRNRLVKLRQLGQRTSGSSARPGMAPGKGLKFKSDAQRDRWETMHAAKTLMQDSRVEFAEPNYRIRPSAIPNDTRYPLQWHYPLIGMPEAWDTTSGNSSVIIAVIDTGILAGHPDLSEQLVPGYDFVQDVDNADDNDGIDPNPNDPGDNFGGNSSFHGTHVAGTVAARGNNSQGVIGVAYRSKIMPLRALGIDGGTTYDLEQSLRFAAGLSNNSGTIPAQAADIINMSLGDAPFTSSLQNLILQIRDRGIILVAAAGNGGSSIPDYPAAFDGVISVSAVDSQRRITNYSNTGAEVDVAAPGGDSSVDLTGDGYGDGVLSTSGSADSGSLSYVYAFVSGTSMAAPHVSGVLALMKSLNPDLSPDDIDSMLTRGELTTDLGAPGRDNLYGHGLINGQLAVLAALTSIGSTPADNPRLVASSTSLNFGALTNELDLSLVNGGKGDLELLAITISEPWLSISPTSVDDNDLGDYTITVNRNGLSAGVYAADLAVQSSVNSLSVRVFMSVGGEDFASDVGVLYVLLYDPEAEDAIYQDVSENSLDGSYPFRFDNVPPGEYELIAGSDADNDFFICDAGESCGAYLTINSPVTLRPDANRNDLDFAAQFPVSLPTLTSGSSIGLKIKELTEAQKPAKETGYSRKAP